MMLHHICIQTDCYDESIKFYEEILGFEMVKETKGFHGRHFNSWIKRDNFMIELQTNKVDEDLIDYNKRSKGIAHVAFMVDDIEYEYERIKTLGYNTFIRKKDQDIYEVEGGKLFKILAPEGTIIEVRDQKNI